jgi:hypothetical protein
MPIPDNINRDHIIQAIRKIDRDDVPAKRGKRKWALEFEGCEYPCKLVISWANIFANGEELDPSPKNFTTYDAQRYLTGKNFKIVHL